MVREYVRRFFLRGCQEMKESPGDERANCANGKNMKRMKGDSTDSARDLENMSGACPGRVRPMSRELPVILS